jgi:molecular chaperone GrpE (heat shock protein)
VDLPTGEARLPGMSGLEAELAAVQQELSSLRGDLARAREEARAERERAEREVEERKKALAQAARQAERAQKTDVALQISRQGRDQAEQQLMEARAQISRQQTDLDRAQERRRREVEEARRSASRQGLEELVPVLDNLEMALLHAAEGDPWWSSNFGGGWSGLGPSGCRPGQAALSSRSATRRCSNSTASTPQAPSPLSCAAAMSFMGGSFGRPAWLSPWGRLPRAQPSRSLSKQKSAPRLRSPNLTRRRDRTSALCLKAWSTPDVQRVASHRYRPWHHQFMRGHHRTGRPAGHPQ